MAVTGDQVATLRAYLSGDFDEHDRLHARLDPVAARTGYSALISAGFVLAVERRFDRDTPDAGVIAFVDRLRARSTEIAASIDPRVAERLIRAVYTDEQIDDLDSEMRLTTQFLLMTALIVEDRLDQSGLEKFLAEARELADEWIG
jgi:hypothetical protein